MPIDLTPVPEISTDHFRSHLRDYLDLVRGGEERFLITRRGRAMAGLVPAHEARACWRVARSSEAYAEWKVLHRLNEERDLRRRVMEEAEAARRKEFEERG
ncbi:type II toxin-antitoxin system Phd/YefM family antitoxin [Roseovarius spongiae]|uniref:Antitoxin n=1 Tax=Roseovarius spongiae TaxID=2320272 RepID=A0A3A8AT04_9RHOB|nr:type II toxin-antitoxin system Phd/YefM family antitoxin [Roseovarius spongiae]RKF13609.1 type II toxin-antitoxin system Phd/YefM family antitoxin [Roseovarius spongiae]